MNCPRCNTNLAMSDTQGVEIDYCPACKGVWLDRGELEKIIERSNEQSSPGLFQQDHDGHYDNRYENRHDSHDGYGNQPRRKKGFLSDIFDF